MVGDVVYPEPPEFVSVIAVITLATTVAEAVAPEPLPPEIVTVTSAELA